MFCRLLFVHCLLAIVLPVLLLDIVLSVPLLDIVLSVPLLAIVLPVPLLDIVLSVPLLVIALSVPLLFIVLSVLRITDSDYPFGIFKLFMFNLRDAEIVICIILNTSYIK